MNSSASIITFIIAVQAFDIITTILAFTTISSPTKKGTQLNYLREAELDGLTSQAFSKVAGIEDKADRIEEVFDNMKHPMELMLFNRACVPYVTEGRPAKSKSTVQTKATRIIADNNKAEDSSIDPMEIAFDSMKHPMELMLLDRACMPYVAEGKLTEPKATVQSVQDDIIDPIEEIFDNMKHPMELMLFNRACVPYVAEIKSSEIQATTIASPNAKHDDDDDDDDDSFVDPMEVAFDTMKHPMEFMLSSQWRQWKFARETPRTQQPIE